MIKVIEYNKIGRISTNHSTGHYILIASSLGFATGLIIGAVGSGGGDNNNGYEIVSTGSLVAGGALVGSLAGALTGTIIGSSKKKETYLINGNLEKFKAAIQKLF